MSEKKKQPESIEMQNLAPNDSNLLDAEKKQPDFENSKLEITIDKESLKAEIDAHKEVVRTLKSLLKKQKTKVDKFRGLLKNAKQNDKYSNTTQYKETLNSLREENDDLLEIAKKYFDAKQDLKNAKMFFEGTLKFERDMESLSKSKDPEPKEKIDNLVRKRNEIYLMRRDKDTREFDKFKLSVERRFTKDKYNGILNKLERLFTRKTKAEKSLERGVLKIKKELQNLEAEASSKNYLLDFDFGGFDANGRPAEVADNVISNANKEFLKRYEQKTAELKNTKNALKELKIKRKDPTGMKRTLKSEVNDKDTKEFDKFKLSVERRFMKDKYNGILNRFEKLFTRKTEAEKSLEKDILKIEKELQNMNAEASSGEYVSDNFAGRDGNVNPAGDATSRFFNSYENKSTELKNAKDALNDLKTKRKDLTSMKRTLKSEVNDKINLKNIEGINNSRDNSRRFE